MARTGHIHSKCVSVCLGRELLREVAGIVLEPVSAYMSGAYGQEMTSKSSPDENADREATAHRSDGGAKRRPRAPSEGDTSWDRAVGLHWHTYSATAGTSARADLEDGVRASKPKHIASQRPDERG